MEGIAFEELGNIQQNRMGQRGNHRDRTKDSFDSSDLARVNHIPQEGLLIGLQ